jgi:hypothetical protein
VSRRGLIAVVVDMPDYRMEARTRRMQLRSWAIWLVTRQKIQQVRLKEEEGTEWIYHLPSLRILVFVRFNNSDSYD